ncbi:MAG: metallophosphoesterase [Isosphaeraceae bacterium]|nr:metallophosphoesterase [Isosphaeraceae bacterium]
MMNVSRTLKAATWPLVCCSALVQAQESAPKTNASAPQNASAKAPKAEVKAPEGPFLVKPYLQPGHSVAAGKVVLMWHAVDSDSTWSVETRAVADGPWQPVAKAPSAVRIDVPTIEPHRVYHLSLTGLAPGKKFGYRIRQDSKVVFEAEGRAPRPADQKQRFVVFGDCGANTPEQKAIAYRAFLAKPHYVMITGDIVYGKGLISEYRTNFWPVYNADTASPSEGAPLLRSTLFLAAPGNHDIASRDLGKTPDGLAYFYYWFQPLNGPVAAEGSPLVAPVVGPEETKKAFLAGAGKAFPRMANYSMDYGNAHWTVLDANATVDWTNRELQDWVAKDLADAKGATWRFVSFHQPGFSSSKSHFDEQYMRILSPIFEAGKVDLVFNGHVHNYQRTYPMTFVPAKENGAKPTVGPDGKLSKARRVDGKWTLDKKFNGKSDTTPEGVIYVVSGAGGQHLYNPEQQDDPASWQEFTFKHISKDHSLTVTEIDGSTLTLRQLTAEGYEVDSFVITK